MSDAFAYRALQLKRSLGTRVAAGFLRNRNVPIHLAVALLARRNT